MDSESSAPRADAETHKKVTIDTDIEESIQEAGDAPSEDTENTTLFAE